MGHIGSHGSEASKIQFSDASYGSHGSVMGGSRRVMYVCQRQLVQASGGVVQVGGRSHSHTGQTADQGRSHSSLASYSDTRIPLPSASLVAVSVTPPYAFAADCLEGEARCLSRGCYNATRRCDGVSDCADHSDELGCE